MPEGDMSDRLALVSTPAIQSPSHELIREAVIDGPAIEDDHRISGVRQKLESFDDGTKFGLRR